MKNSYFSPYLYGFRFMKLCIPISDDPVNWVPTQYSIPCYSTVFVSSISTWMYGKSSSKWYDSEIFTPSDLKKYENTIIWSFYYVISTASTSFINRNFWTTVRNDWVLTKARLWSKLSLFKMSWQMLEVLLQLSPLYQSIPYLRAFQWGTVWPYTSRGIKNTTGQSWKFNFY